MNKTIITFFILLPLIIGCVKQFIPSVDEGKDFLVVDGLVTDQNFSYRVRLSRTSKLGPMNTITPVKNCIVSVTDDFGTVSLFRESRNGIYISDSLTFRGEPGRKYTLNISDGSNDYQSDIMEMKPVPPIDSLYPVLEYNDSYTLGKTVPGYQVYLNTGDTTHACKFYRWNFVETWEFRIPFDYPTIINRICWKYDNSDKIYLKDVSALKENRITSYPLNFITTETDRLQYKYSILVNQYSLIEEEYQYWEKLKRVTENVGSLYDVVPMSINGNVHCTSNPSEMVLGYFSVSSVASERIFIKNTLVDFPNFYSKCPIDTVYVGDKIQGLNEFVFIIGLITDWPGPPPPPPYLQLADYYVLTDKKECLDCTLNGSNVIPPYWNLTGKYTYKQSLFDGK